MKPSPASIFSFTSIKETRLKNGDTLIARSNAASLAEFSSCSRVSTIKLEPVDTAKEIFEIKLFSSSTTNFWKVAI